jgi:hypothetical protein
MFVMFPGKQVKRIQQQISLLSSHDLDSFLDKDQGRSQWERIQRAISVNSKFLMKAVKNRQVIADQLPDVRCLIFVRKICVMRATASKFSRRNAYHNALT